MDDKAIGQRISELRKALGISQIGMAKELSMDRNSLRNIETGKTSIINEHIADIAAILGISEEKLLLGYEPCRPGDPQSLDDVKSSYNRKIQDINNAHDDKVDDLRAQIAVKDELIASLRQQIDTKEEIIRLLRKRKNS